MARMTADEINPDDFTDGPAPRRAASGGGAPATAGAAQQKSSGPSWQETAWTAIAGNGKDPGALGIGTFRGDFYSPNTDAARVPGAAGMERTFREGAANAGNRSAATMEAATIDGSQQAQFRDAQSAVLSDTMAAARGEGPSVAQTQLQRSAETNIANAAALQSSRRGLGTGTGLRDIATQAASIAQDTAGQSAILRAQEVATARGQAAQLATGARGQDLDLATSQANLQQQANTANLNSETEQRRMNDAMVQEYLAKGLTLAQAEQAARMEMERLRVQQNLGQNQIEADAFRDAAARRGQFMGGAMEAGANLMTMGA